MDTKGDIFHARALLKWKKMLSVSVHFRNWIFLNVFKRAERSNSPYSL